MDNNELENYRYAAITYVRLFANIFHLEGEKIAPLLDGTPLTPEYVFGECEYITLNEQYQILKNIVTHYPLSGLGIIQGSHASLYFHGSMGMATLTSSTLREGLKTLIKYYVLRVPFVQLELHETDDEIIVVAQQPDTDSQAVNRFIVESVFSSIQKVSEQMTGLQIKSAAMHLAFPEPEDRTQYDKYLHCKVSFGQSSCNRYHLPRSIADRPSITSATSLHKQSIELCQEEALRIKQLNTITNRVIENINIHGDCITPLAELADTLCMSTRQLIRRLQQEGTSYREIVDNYQKKLAVKYLKDQSLSIELISEMLGYSQTSNFRRVFRRWYGLTPSDFRKKLSGNSRPNI